jgi:hypothetical protein
MHNYDLNITNNQLQVIEFTVQFFEFVHKFSIETKANMTGLDIINWALDEVYVNLPMTDDQQQLSYINFIGPEGELTVADDDNEGRAWLGRMVTEVRIISQVSDKGIAYRHRYKESNEHTVNFGQWSDWEYCDEDKYNEICAYIKSGYTYEAQRLVSG